MCRLRDEINRDMSLRKAVILSIGECMVELARTGDGRFEMAFGGDTFNTALYLARLGGPSGLPDGAR